MASMVEELGQKSEEVRKYHAEHTMVFTRIQELIGHPGEIVNKARLYDQLVESGDPVSARQTIPILVKYSRMMNNLFAEKWEGGSAGRNSSPGTISRATRIANRDPLRGGRRGSPRAKSAHGSKAQLARRRFRTREFRKRSGQDSFLGSPTEEYRICTNRICEVRTWAFTGSQDFGPV